MDKTVFLLGAWDPEMEAVKELLAKAGLTYREATYKGKPVSPRTAYCADPIQTAERLVLVECNPKVVPADAEIVRIDHHNPGDYGYDLGPDRYLEASSIGQLICFLQNKYPGLGWSIETVPERIRHIAAIDHCLGDAYRGRCPGVIPGKLYSFRFQSLALEKGVQVGTVRALVRQCRQALKEAKHIPFGHSSVADMRDVATGLGYSLQYMGLREAALISGVPYLVRSRNTEDEPVKVVLNGMASQEEVSYFMNIWGPAEGLVDIFGVPMRGYAGGFVSSR